MLGKDKSSLIHTNMNGDNPRELAGEFAAIRRAKPKLQKACAHMILSVVHRDIDHPKGEFHEHLTDEQYAQIGSRYLQEMEFVGEEELASSLFVIARHGDRSHEHIHIIASRIRMDGEVVSDSWDWYRSEVAARKLEKEFGLQISPCSSERIASELIEQGIEATVTDNMMRSPSIKELKNKSEKPSVRQLIADRIDLAIENSPSYTQFIAKLREFDVYVRPRLSKDSQQIQGVSFRLNGIEIAGGRIGRGYSINQLYKRGLSYEPQRDKKAVFLTLQEVEKQVELEEQVAPISTSVEENTPADIPEERSKSFEDNTTTSTSLSVTTSTKYDSKGFTELLKNPKFQELVEKCGSVPKAIYSLKKTLKKHNSSQHKTPESKHINYHQKYQEYSQQVRKQVQFNNELAINVEIAALALQKQDNTANATWVILESPYVQLGLKQGKINGIEALDYATQVVKYAKSRNKLNDNQIKIAHQVGNITAAILKNYSNNKNYQDNIYSLKRDDNELVVLASPNRKSNSKQVKQEILRFMKVDLDSGKKSEFLLHSQLTEQDLRYFQQKLQELSASKSVKCKKNKKKDGMGIGD